MSRRSRIWATRASLLALSVAGVIAHALAACEPMAGPQYPGGAPPSVSVVPVADDGGAAPAPSISAQPGDIHL